MSDLSEIFQQVQLQINAESLIKEELHTVEAGIAIALAGLKKTHLTGNVFQIAPLDLHKTLSQAVHDDTNTQARKVYHQLLEAVDKVPLQPDQASGPLAVERGNTYKHLKERVVRRVNEEVIYALLLNRYLMCIATLFRNPTTSIHHPIITGTDTTLKGLIMAPEEVKAVLDAESLNHSDYLMCLLRLSDDLVVYSTQTIIQVSIANNAQYQYSLSLVNAKLSSFLQSGFELLDLKNDNLRRKYDGLKYHLKQANNIVYDLSLRQLLSTEVVLF